MDKWDRKESRVRNKHLQWILRHQVNSAGERKDFLINGKPNTQWKKINLNFYPIFVKVNLKEIIDLSVRAKTVKLLEKAAKSSHICDKQGIWGTQKN